MTKERMLDNIIKKWGFEHDFTITFAIAIDDTCFTTKMIDNLYRDLMDL